MVKNPQNIVSSFQNFRDDNIQVDCCDVHSFNSMWLPEQFGGGCVSALQICTEAHLRGK